MYIERQTYLCNAIRVDALVIILQKAKIFDLL